MKIKYFFLLLLCVVGNNLFGMDERSEQVNRALHSCIEKLGRAAANSEQPDQAVIALAEELLQESHVVYDQSILIDLFRNACTDGYENIAKLSASIIDQNIKLKREVFGDLSYSALSCNRDMIYRSCLGCSCRGNHKNITKTLLKAHEFDLLCTVDNCVMLTLLIKSLLYSKHNQHVISEHIGCLLSYLKDRINDAQWNEWIESTDNYDRTILHTICDCHYPHKVPVLELFLKYGIRNINIKNSKGHTPLQTAVLCDSASFRRFGGEFDDENNKKDSEDANILKDTINLFLKYNADIHTVDCGKTGLLHSLLGNNKFSWSLYNVQQLLKSGVNPLVQDKAGRTPLHLFIMHHNPRAWAERGRSWHTKFSWFSYEVIHILLQGKANVQKEDNKGHTSLHYAAVQKGSNTGSTPLHYAASNSFYEAVPVLLFHGAKFTTKSGYGHEAIGLVGSEEPLGQFFTYDTTNVLAKDIFKKEFMTTELGQRCMHDCATYCIGAAEQVTGGSSCYKYIKHREIGYKQKR